MKLTAKGRLLTDVGRTRGHVGTMKEICDEFFWRMLKQTAKSVLGPGTRERVGAFYFLIERYWYKRVAYKHLRRIRRETRELCWCGGRLSPFQWQLSYGVCQACGCYVNRRPPLQEELKRLYSLDLYWHIKQRADGLPTIEQRPAYDKGDGRVDFMLKLIAKYGPAKGRVIEIGCAHGIVLKELKEHGYECIGVEIDERTASWTSNTMGVEVRTGVFPGIKLPPCDIFLSCDVLEHVNEPEAFMNEAARLLNPGGIAIIQTAVDRYDYVPPFGRRFRHAFDDSEHVYIFTDKALQELARRAVLKVVTLSECIWLMGEICVFEKSNEA